MKSNKIFIISNDQEHFWQSCNVIEDAVHEAFKDKSDVQWFNVSDLISEQNILSIEKYSKDHNVWIYFLSDNIHYQDIIQQLKKYKDLNYIIPIYGNMTVEIERWIDLHKILSSEKVIFLAASHRSAQQLSLFIEGGLLLKVPYPITKMHFSSLTNNDNSEIGIVYAGRITLQKNILPVMNKFNQARKIRPELKLHIAGDFHDRGFPLHGLRMSLESYKTDFFKAITDSDGGIVYHGQLTQAELLKLNSTCDYTMSMSVHHDEDFGVSIAQGLAQGLVPILSDWGGHPDFARVVEGKLIPVTVNEENIPGFSMKHFFMALLDLEKISFSKKIKNQEKASAYLSTESFLRFFESLMLKEIPRYEGQSLLYQEYAEICRTHYPFSIKNPKDKIFNYLSIYQSYLSNFDAETK